MSRSFPLSLISIILLSFVSTIVTLPTRSAISHSVSTRELRDKFDYVDTISAKYDFYKLRNKYGDYYTLTIGDEAIDSCTYFNDIDGTDRYFSYVKKGGNSYIIDASTKISYPLGDNTYEYDHFLTELSYGPLFCSETGLRNLNGLFVSLDPDIIVDLGSSQNSDKLYLYSSYGCGSIPYTSLKNNTQLYIKPTEITDFHHEINGLYQSTELNITLPHIKNNPLLRQNVLFWHSENVIQELYKSYKIFNEAPSKILETFLPDFSTTEDEIAHSWMKILLEGFHDVSEDSCNYLTDEEETTKIFTCPYWGGQFSASLLPLMESDSLITFLSYVDSNFGGGSGDGDCVIPVATFNRSTGKRITIKEIIKKETHENFASCVRRALYKKWPELSYLEILDNDTSVLSLPMGILPNGLYINIPRHTLVGYGGEIFIPFSDIADYLNIDIRAISSKPEDPLFLAEIKSRPIDTGSSGEKESLENETDTSSSEEKNWSFFDLDDPDFPPFDIAKYHLGIDSLIALHSITKQHTTDRIIAASSINGGVNTEMVKIMMDNGDYERAFNTSKMLLEEFNHNNPFGTLIVTSEGYISSKIAYLNQLVDQNLLDKALEIRENAERNLGDLYDEEEENLDFPYTTFDYLLPVVDDHMILSRIMARKGLSTEAIKHVTTAFPRINDHLMTTLPIIPTDKREKLWNHYRDWYMQFLPALAFTTNDSTIRTYALQAVLNGKGIMLNTEMATRKSILEGSDTVAARLLLESDVLKARLNQLTTGSSSKSEETLEDIRRIKTELSEISNSLSARSNSYAANRINMNTSVSDIYGALGDKEAAVEFLLINSKDFDFPPSYFALILKKDSKYPEMVFLGEKEVIENLATSDNTYLNQELYDIIWKPILNLLNDISTIYFAPDGILYTTAIEYLPYDGKGDLIGDSLTLKRLSSTRLISSRRHYKSGSNNHQTEGTGFLYGGIDYDKTSDIEPLHTKSQAKDIHPQPQSCSYTDPVFRSAFSNLSTRARVKPLKGSEEEVNNIQSYARNITGVGNVILITGSEATEESFKNIQYSHPSLLHIATHGFYFTEGEIEKITSKGLINSITSSDKDIDDLPLLRAGLIMAGANKIMRRGLNNSDFLNGKPGLDDGILTAKEISLINLSEIDLATLSACQTGIGDINSDGVMGLQRGFKKAGVNTLLMSLWKVDDVATMLLMTEFYRQLALGNDKTTALKDARNYLRSYGDGKFNHPYFWAAFILLDAD